MPLWVELIFGGGADAIRVELMIFGGGADAIGVELMISGGRADDIWGWS